MPLCAQDSRPAKSPTNEASPSFAAGDAKKTNETRKPTKNTPSNKKKPESKTSDSNNAENKKSHAAALGSRKEQSNRSKGAPTKSSTLDRERPAERKKLQPVRLPLANRTPDGRAIHATGVFQSQLVDAVPRDFRPVSIELLSKSLNSAVEKSTGSKGSVLSSGFYDVRLTGDTLTSDRSTIELECLEEGEFQRVLGRVNFAVLPARSRLNGPDNTSEGELFFSDQGELVAIRDDASDPGKQQDSVVLEFGWNLRGTLSGMKREFDIQIPRTTRTRMILSVPSDIRVECKSAVIQRLPGPPLGEDIVERSGADHAWYAIDAGGLDRITLRTSHVISDEDTMSFVLREESLRYDISPSGVNWLHAMTIQSPGGRYLPEFRVPNGVVTGVEIQNRSFPFSTTTDNEGMTTVVVSPFLGGSTSQTNTYELAIMGTASWDGTTGQCNLPRSLFDQSSIVPVRDRTQAQVIVRNPLEVINWELPSGWSQQPQEVVALDGGKTTAVILRGTGPGKTLDAESDEERTWSSLQMKQRPSVKQAEHWLQLRVDAKETKADRLIAATSRLEIDFETSQAAPIQLQLQPRWTIETITILNSGRVVQQPALNLTDNTFYLWPEPEDLLDSKIVIQLAGSRRVQRNQQLTAIPETWFVRPVNVPTNVWVALIPSAGLNWTGESALRGTRLEQDVLSDEQLVFFDGLSENALLYQPEDNASPSLLLRTPGVSIDVNTSIEFKRDEDDVVETLSITSDIAGQVIGQLTVNTEHDSRPDYRWSIRSSDGSPPINLPSTAVKKNSNDYTIDVGDISLRGRQLVGRRRYALHEKKSLRLPGIARSVTQEGEVILGPGLTVVDRSPSVQLVPTETKASTSSDAESTLRDAKSRFGYTRLRFDAIKQPRIDLDRVDDDPSLSIVWQHQISLTASSRGSDLIRGRFRISSTRPIRIDYEPDLQLVSVYQNGTPVDLATISEWPIFLQPQQQTDTVQVVWSREYVRRGWLRSCRIPEVNVDGVHVESSYRLSASADTFAPSMLFRASTDSESAGLDIKPNHVAILAHRDLALALGWLLSSIVFAIAWVIAKRSLIAIAMVLVITTVSAILWWPWQTAIIAWAIIPIVASALLESATRYGRRQPVAVRQTDHGQHPNDRADDSLDFSLATGLPIWLIAVGLWCLTQSTVVSQDTAHKLPSNQAINVLVPLDSKAKPVGDKVYVPGAFYDELFQSRSLDEPVRATFSSANYQVDLTESSSQSAGFLVKAEYVVHTDGSSRVILPFNDRKIVGGRIEVRQDDESRDVSVSPYEANSVIGTFPAGETFRIMVTLRADSTSDDTWTSVKLAIPQIASSRASIESDRTIDPESFRSAGKVTTAIGLRRTDVDLGPVSTFQLRYKHSGPGTVENTNAAKRSYWIHAGSTTTTVECQIEFASKIKVGDQIGIQVPDGRLPQINSAAWRISESDSASSRKQISITKLADVETPLHLLWQIPSVVNNPISDNDSVAMLVPDIRIPTYGDFESTAFAVQSDPEVRVSLVQPELVSSLNANAFLSAWKGFRYTQRITQTFVAKDLPEFVMMESQPPQVTQDVTHHLHAMRDQIQLRMRAVITPSNSSVGRHVLRVPAGYKLVRASVAGKLIDIRASKSKKGYFEVALGEFSGNEPISVEALCTQRSSGSRQRDLAAMQIWPTIPGKSIYSLTRSDDVKVKLLSPSMEGLDQQKVGNETALLKSGWVAIANWELPDSSSPNTPLKFDAKLQITPKNTRYTCNQNIEMNYAAGIWSMETTLELTRKLIPDFVDIELPTRWCKSLEVKPESVWIQRASTEPTKTMIRISTDSLEGSEIKLTSQLATNDQGRVDVPRVTLLGNVNQVITIQVPRRLGSERIEWTGTGVTQNGSTYKARPRDDWSIELTSLSDTRSEPQALTADARVFIKDDETLVICRWDIVPNGIDSLNIRLPDSAKCLGAWTAGKPVRFTSVVDASDPDSGSTKENRTNQVNVPLSISRLAQSVEVLLSIPISSARRKGYIPELVDVFVPNIWVATHKPTGTRDAPISRQLRDGAANEISPLENRALGLARASVNAIDQSLGTLAERPANEVATWLLPWITRYEHLAYAGGHRFKVLDDEAPSTSTDDTSTSLRTLSSTDREWNNLDRKINSYALQFLTKEHLKSRDQFRPLFENRNFDGYLLTDIKKVSAVSPLKPIQAMSSQMQDLRVTLLNLLTLVMVGGLLFQLKPFAALLSRLCENPVFWLAAMGMFALVIAPMPVAAAILLLAFTCGIEPARRLAQAWMGRSPTA